MSSRYQITLCKEVLVEWSFMKADWERVMKERAREYPLT